MEVTAQWVCVKGDGEDDVGDGHDIWPENLVLSDCVRPRRRKCFGISLRCCRLGCLRVGWMLMLGCDTPHSESPESAASHSAAVGSPPAAFVRSSRQLVRHWSSAGWLHA